jgi:hypothetical protein
MSGMRAHRLDTTIEEIGMTDMTSSSARELGFGDNTLNSLIPEEPGPTSLVVQIGQQLIVFGDTYTQGPQCVARRPNGLRCGNSAQDGYDGWMTYYIEGTENYGYVSVLMTETDDRNFLRQRCSAHVDKDTPDVLAPTWEPFDAERDADLIQYRTREIWTPSGLKSTTWKGASRKVVRTSYSEMAERERTRELLAKAREARVEPQAVTALYSYYDGEEILLYVGITDDLAAREWSHVQSSSWMEFATRSTIERFPNRKAALGEEKRRIKAERPLFNSQHNDDPAAVRRLVEYLIEHDRRDLLMPAVSRG